MNQSIMEREFCKLFFRKINNHFENFHDLNLTDILIRTKDRVVFFPNSKNNSKDSIENLQQLLYEFSKKVVSLNDTKLKEQYEKSYLAKVNLVKEFEEIKSIKRKFKELKDDLLIESKLISNWISPEKLQTLNVKAIELHKHVDELENKQKKLKPIFTSSSKQEKTEIMRLMDFRHEDWFSNTFFETNYDLL